ncbi:MAG: hypothetical protein ACD_39C01787G0003 [uncultured bacterium]|nr:MAG: hypothetical protein ACD_39C01787G0003 [uncultured bacterium]
MFNLSGNKVNLVILFGLFLAAFSFLGIASLHVPPQASLDSAYYHIMVDQLEKGAGFTEPFIWHFLNDYQTIEHPMDYWMPLGIVFYYLVRLGFGASAEVWANIFIWSLLSVFVFVEVAKVTGKRYVAAFAFLTMLFSGRFLFYVLTTDNIAFYALFGFIFFKQLGSKKSRWYFTSIAGGLAALMRIEGLLIAIWGGLFEFHKARTLKTLIGYFIVLVLVLSPWMIRNYRVLSDLWPSNSKALFLQEYNDMFRRDVQLNPEHYFSMGGKAIFNQKLQGIWRSLLDFVAAPGLMVMYPLWLAGLLVLWKSSGRYFVLLLTFFLLFCGLVVPVQIAKGSAFHISAFFFPFFTVFGGAGLGYVQDHYRMTAKSCVVIILLVTVWSVCATFYSSVLLVNQYAFENAPYESMLARLSFAVHKIVSVAPIKVYLESGAPGVIGSSVDQWEPFRLADDYSCDAIIIDKRATDYQPLPENIKWQEVASDTYLNVYFRKTAD